MQDDFVETAKRLGANGVIGSGNIIMLRPLNLDKSFNHPELERMGYQYDEGKDGWTNSGNSDPYVTVCSYNNGKYFSNYYVEKLWQLYKILLE